MNYETLVINILFFEKGYAIILCMKTKKTNMKNLMIRSGLIVVFAMILGLFFGRKEVGAISVACQSSPACVEAAAKEAEANKKAQEATGSANAFQQKANETAAEIATKEAEIANSQVEVSELQTKIEKTKEEIERDKDALADLLVKMHFQADAEPIRILAGATSISDLAEKAAREEVARQEINAQATKIREAKQKLEEDKTEVENKLALQESIKVDLMAKKKERDDLVAKYQNDAEGYEAVAKEEREKKQAAEREWQSQHQQSLSGVADNSFFQKLRSGEAATVSGPGGNSYPWQGDCPGKQDYYMTYLDGRAVGGYVCECVSYAGWKAYESYGLYLAWGNASTWDDYARGAGYRVDHSPEAGTVGQVDGGMYGHVFWVESVNGDGSINVTEYNNAMATRLFSGSFHYGDFGARTIPAYEVGQYNYIHF